MNLQEFAKCIKINMTTVTTTVGQNILLIHRSRICQNDRRGVCHAEKRSRVKPGKPHVGFPLTAHRKGPWCKKNRGKIHYFGPWEDPEAAMRRYLQVAKDLYAGR